MVSKLIQLFSLTMPYQSNNSDTVVAWSVTNQPTVRIMISVAIVTVFSISMTVCTQII